jgi:UDP-N-acetylmuramate-alanine ligase
MMISQQRAESRCHVVGVAGVGMSALARAALSSGYVVTGSDRYLDQGEALPVLSKLRHAGVGLVPQDGSGVEAECAALVVSTAIEADNPDILAARRFGVPIVHRAEMLARLVGDRPCVAVTGTSGKSTVAGMIGWLLDRVGADPFVVNGAPVVHWIDDDEVGNVRAGSGPWVIEADESDRSLLCFQPAWGVITNVSADHFPVAEAEQIFRTFALRATRGVVSTLHEPRLLETFCPHLEGAISHFELGGTSFDVRLPGRHNAENALIAVETCRRMGFRLEKLAPAMAAFRGIERRLQPVGEVGTICVFDDYGHNPAKIRAAWLAVAARGGRVRAVWRPHGFAPLRTMAADLIATFGELRGPADSVFVLPVYDAGGTADRSYNTTSFIEAARRASVQLDVVCDYDEAVTALTTDCRPGDTLLVMGARDPGLPSLARQLVTALHQL